MPVQNSQDLDARFAIFLNPIRDLTKNWEVDIAKYLEEYLVELSEIQITFDGGETTMNFAEAAMLIQGSATVYSKKVEFLWQMVLQMLDLLSSKRSLESRADNSKGGEGGRHKQVDLFIEFEKVEKLCDGKTINMKDDDEEEEEEMKNSFKFLPEMPLHLVEKESEKSLMKIVLYLKNKETFGNKDDFRINRSYLTPSGLLYLDLPPEILKKQMHVEKIIASSADDSIAGFLHIEDETPASQNNLVGVEENNMAPPQEEMEDFMGNDNFDHLDSGNDHPNSPEMPPFDPPENVEIEKNPISAGLKDDCEKLDIGSSGKYGLRSRNAPKEVAPKVKLTEPLKPLDPHVETIAKRPIRAGRIRKPLPCMCHREPTKAKRNRNSKDEVSLYKGDKILPSVESFITRDLANLISNNNNDIKNKVVDSRLLEELTSEESKRQEKCKKKKVKELMNNENNLTLEEIKVRLLEEAQQQNKVADRMADDVYDDHIPDLDLDDLGGGDDDFAMPNPHNNDVFDDFDRLTGSDPNRNLNDSALYEPGSDYEALVQKWVSDYIASAQEHIASSELTMRVNKWRKIITPKLQEEEERQSFDIHSYGSHILDHFPDNCPDNILFDEVAHGKSSYEVSRLFLSCLMLANTYNIELSQTREGDLEMDCLQLKLLSKVRHHKEMEENLPPSVKKKKSKQDKRKKQVSSDDENAADNSSSISADESQSVAATNKNLKAKNPKKLKVTENYSNI